MTPALALLTASLSLVAVLVTVASIPSPSRTGRSLPTDGGRGDQGPDRSALDDLLARAGRAGELSVRSVRLARIIGMVAFPLPSLPIAGLLPGRFGLLLTGGLAALGFLAPTLILERAARRRQVRIVAGLPDALDLLAVQLGAGRGFASAMEDIARAGKGPLAVEFGLAAAEMARGAPQSAALQRLRERVGGREVSSFCATVERSRRLGSPLAEELRRQASSARIEQGRAVAERAARAAPKIQLVIALVLVPAVMLLVVAALVANSDRLLGFAFG